MAAAAESAAAASRQVRHRQACHLGLRVRPMGPGGVNDHSLSQWCVPCSTGLLHRNCRRAQDMAKSTAKNASTHLILHTRDVGAELYWPCRLLGCSCKDECVDSVGGAIVDPQQGCMS